MEMGSASCGAEKASGRCRTFVHDPWSLRDQGSSSRGEGGKEGMRGAEEAVEESLPDTGHVRISSSGDTDRLRQPRYEARKIPEHTVLAPQLPIVIQPPRIQVPVVSDSSGEIAAAARRYDAHAWP